jgi:hypothetical protein
VDRRNTWTDEKANVHFMQSDVIARESWAQEGELVGLLDDDCLQSPRAEVSLRPVIISLFSC